MKQSNHKTSCRKSVPVQTFYFRKMYSLFLYIFFFLCYDVGTRGGSITHQADISDHFRPEWTHLKFRKEDPMKKLKKQTAVKTAEAVAVVLFLLSVFGARAEAYNITWPEKQLYEHYYVLAETGGSDYNNGYEYQDITAFYKTVRDTFKAWQSMTGVDLTSDKVFPNAEWNALMSGQKKIQDPDHVPNHEAFIALWQKMIDDGLTGNVTLNGANTMRSRLIAFFAEDSKVWFRSDYSKRTNYIRLTVPTDLIPSRYDPSVNSVGYCTQINYDYPGKGTVSSTAEPASLKEALAMDDVLYEKLLNVLKRGYPVDVGLQDSGFESLPAEARQQGTQFAVWLILQGTVGNDGNGPAFSGKTLRREMLKNLADPGLNPGGNTLDVCAYIDYLLTEAENEPVTSISAVFEPFTEADGYFISLIRLAGKCANKGGKLRLEGLPEGSMLIAGEDTVLQENSEYSFGNFNTSELREETLTLRVPKEGNAGRVIRLTAEAYSGMEEGAVSLWFQEADDRTQRMAVIEKEAEIHECAARIEGMAVTPEETTEEESDTTEETADEPSTEESTDASTEESTEETTDASTEETTEEPSTAETTKETEETVPEDTEAPGETTPATSETVPSSTASESFHTQESPSVKGASKTQILGARPDLMESVVLPVAILTLLAAVLTGILCVRRKREQGGKRTADHRSFFDKK